MRVRARTLVGLVVLASIAIGGGLINAKLKSISRGFGLGDQPTRISIVFLLQRNQELHYRLGPARVFRMIVNANLPADDLANVRASAQPLWFDLKLDVEDDRGLVLHRQDLSFRMDPTPGMLDPEGRYYLNHFLVPAAGKVRNLDLSDLREPERLNIRMGDADPSIVDLSIRLFKVTRTAERELAYLWTRMSNERRESLARSNLFGRQLMTEDEKVNQLRHRWFPLPPEGTDSKLQRKLYTRIDEQPEETPAGHTSPVDSKTTRLLQTVAPADWPLDGLRRSFAYVLASGEPYIQAIHHVGSNPTPLRLDLRRWLPANEENGTTSLRWRLLGPEGREYSSGVIVPQEESASAEAVNLPGRQTSEPLRRYFMVSAAATGFELTALGSPLLFTLAVAHPLQTLQISTEPGANSAGWFLVRSPDHRQRLTDGRAVTIWKGPRTPDQDQVEYSWERIEPDGNATWRSLSEPIEDEGMIDGTLQRLALNFEAAEFSFSIKPAPGQERLILLRWHAPAGRTESLEIEVDIDGQVPVNQPLSGWTSLKRRVTMEPGHGEYPVQGTDEFVRSPHRTFIRIGPDFDQKTLTVIVRSAEPAGYLSASIGAPAAKEWRTLVKSSTDSTSNGKREITPSNTLADGDTESGRGR